MSMDDWPEPFAELDDPAMVPGPPDEGTVDASDADFDAVPGDELLGLLVGSAVGQRMVQIGLSQRGVVESGGEDAGVPFDRYARPFGFTRPVPWCACFVSWCYLQTTGRRPPWPNPAYAGSIYNWAQGTGKLTRSPSQGDLFGISDRHVGMVAARLLHGRILTIEGNWSDRVLSREVAVSGLWFASV